MLPFEYAVENGFDAFEWFPDRNVAGAGWDPGSIDEPARSQIRETALARSIRLSVHAPWQANPLESGAVERLLESLKFARELGAALLNIHLHPELGLDAYLKAIEPLTSRLPELAIQLSLENTPATTPWHFNELFRRLRDSSLPGSAKVGMCLDVGHANLCHATRNDYLRFIDLLDPGVPIIHIHLHENWGDQDSHLPIFTGPAARDSAGVEGVIRRLKQRNFCGSIILEQWPQPPALLNQARERLLRLLGPASAPPEHTGGGRLAGISAPSGAVPWETSPPGSLEAADQIQKQSVRDEDAFVSALAASNQHCRSWREKLSLVSSLLAPGLTTEQLACLAIYLRFVGTGEIASLEDGGHFRPRHAATISRDIQERLARLATPANSAVIRKIYPWLPSADRAFTTAEPLTRIRDIAHRNDIPQELKKEIKHTLQNKLHRCAGPEDLVTSAAILERITAPGANYSPAFVEQFQIFHEELKEFFNARSLDEQLQAIAQKGAGKLAELARRLLEAREKISQGIEQQFAILELLTALRRTLLAQMEAPGSAAQEFRLADIALESFCFVLLSRMNNSFDGAGEGSSLPPSGKEPSWDLLLRSLALTVDNLSLTGISPEEHQAIQSELEAWRAAFSASEREHLLRLKATVDRCRRLADEYSDWVMALFAPRVRKLGCALGVAKPALENFVDSEIRGHLVFQLSKLAATVLRSIKRLAGLPSCEVIVSGKAAGRLVAAVSLEALRESPHAEIVALLRSAQGDEEIPENVRGIVLSQAIPHLSHLGVRARQSKVVFAACEDRAEFASFEALGGEWTMLDAGERGIKLEPCAQTVSDLAAAVGKGADCRPASRPVGRVRDGRGILRAAAGGSRPLLRTAELPLVRLNPEKPLIRLEEVVQEEGGGKATSARRLDELSRRAGEFRTPPGLVVPFGVMERALRARPELEAEYQCLVSRLGQSSTQVFVATVQALRELVLRLPPPKEIAFPTTQGSSDFGFLAATVAAPENDQVSAGLPALETSPRPGLANPTALRLMVRSSANAEDLEEFTAAGLYDSLPNVPLSEVADAVRKVWASLWTERAALSRRQAGIPHQSAHMAVLIQKMIEPDYSFIMHTVNPVSRACQQAYVELAVGLGETLASAGAPGAPYRLLCNKQSGETRVLAFANYSQAIRPAPGGGVERRTVDYSKLRLSQDAGFRRALGARLARIARLVEDEFGRPQDIEGAVIAGEIYLVQSRLQQGLR